MLLYLFLKLSSHFSGIFEQAVGKPAEPHPSSTLRFMVMLLQHLCQQSLLLCGVGWTRKHCFSSAWKSQGVTDNVISFPEMWKDNWQKKERKKERKKGREGKGREGKGREGKGREGKKEGRKEGKKERKREREKERNIAE